MKNGEGVVSFSFYFVSLAMIVVFFPHQQVRG